MGSMAQTGLLLVPSDALGHTWALPGVLGAGQGLPPKGARRTLMDPLRPRRRARRLGMGRPTTSMATLLSTYRSRATTPAYGGDYRATPGKIRTLTCSCCCSSRSAGSGTTGVGEILRKAANVLQNKLTRAQYLDEVTWTTKNWLGLQKQRISVVLHTAIESRYGCE